MSIEHKDMPEAGRHQPRGGSTAEAGEALVSLGSDQTEFRKLDVVHTELMLAQDFSDQVLTVAGQEARITAGAEKTSLGGEVHLSDIGVITFLKPGTYFLRLTIRPKRVGTSGEASMMIKTVLNGSMIPSATRQISIDGSEAGSFSASFNFTASTNDTIAAVLLYDFQPGSDAAGLYPYVAQNAAVPAEWPDTPSAQVRISKVETA